MNILEFTLVGDDEGRIAIDLDAVYTFCEVKEKKATKTTKGSSAGTSIKMSSDDLGWLVKETYDEVMNKITTAQAILDAAEADDDTGESN